MMGQMRHVWLAVCLLAGCTSLGQPLPVEKPEQLQSAQPTRLQLELGGQSLSESQLPDFLVQHYQGKGDLAKAFSRQVKTWFERHRNPDARRSPELLIANVLDTESGLSMMGASAPASIEPDFAGKEVQLTLQGTFKDQRKDLQLKNFRFTLEPPLIQQTFVGQEPKARVLLDDSILLEPVSVTGTELKVLLRTAQVPDLYLKGLHKLSVEYGNWYTDALVRVGEPAPTPDLNPRIDQVEILRERGKPLHLRLSGFGFPLFPKFYYTVIDGQFGFGFQTEVAADGSAQTVVHIPTPETFDQTSKHVVIMATPFGVAFKEFGL